MDRGERLSRRRALEATGLAGLALLAGCADAGPGEDDADEPGEPDDPDDPEDDQPQDPDLEAWEGVDEIYLEAETGGWTGVEPDAIEGEPNPVLLLEEGEEYEITFENIDGEPHNLVLWSDEHEVVGENETELVEQEGEALTLEFEAQPEMGEYACEPHTDSMNGSIEFIDEYEDEGTEDGDESEEGEAGEESE